MSTEPNSQAAISQPQVTISWEVVAYAVLIIAALLLHLAELDSVPMAQAEAHQAMRTLQIVAPQTPGNAPAPDSPILFVLQSLAFSIMGASELSARLGTVLGGMLLILTPLLFRRFIGRERTFLLAVLLAVSPTIFVVSRQADAFIWTAVFAMTTVALVWRVWADGPRSSSVLWLAASVAGLILLSDSGGPLLAAMMALAAWLALWWSAFRAPDEVDESGEVLFQNARAWLQILPWRTMLAAFAGITIVASTLFMLYPAGLGHVGNLLANTLAGFVRPAAATMPPGLGLAGLLVYELGFVILALAAIISLMRQGRFGYVQRFLAIWALLAAVTGLLYRGATPAFAIWSVLPMVFLIADYALGLFSNIPVIVYWTEGFVEQDASGQRYAWIKYAISLLIIGAFVIVSVHLQEIGRGLQRIPVGAGLGDALATMREPIMAEFRYSLLFFFVTLLFIVISLMLVASIWGNRTMLQALGIGFFVYVIGTSLGGGWQTAVVHASNPAEYWYSATTEPDAYLLRETLYEISERESGGEPLISIVAVRGTALEDDGLVGWLLRDYPNTEYVGTFAEAARNPIVLLPEVDVNLLNLGGDYVGQPFEIMQPTLAYDVSLVDVVAWMGQRRLRSFVGNKYTVSLWLRQDVYDALPEEERERLGID
ncbi:MAG: glycosyltransferase family 39 protein [Anaerolineaceae bacterium]|nr:glycosyltransferase family 39 protein [Anaerolineaceae bacterium]